MLVQYELTRDEHREALAAMVDSQSREAPTKWFWIVLPLFAIEGVLIGMVGDRIGADPQTMFLNCLIPSISLILAGGIAIAINQVLSKRKSPSWRIILMLCLVPVAGLELELSRLMG